MLSREILQLSEDVADVETGVNIPQQPEHPATAFVYSEEEQELLTQAGFTLYHQD